MTSEERIEILGKRKSVQLYIDQIYAANEMPAEEFKQYFMAVVEFLTTEDEPEGLGMPGKMLFLSNKSNLQKANESYIKQACQAGRGKDGGRPKLRAEDADDDRSDNYADASAANADGIHNNPDRSRNNPKGFADNPDGNVKNPKGYSNNPGGEDEKPSKDKVKEKVKASSSPPISPQGEAAAAAAGFEEPHFAAPQELGEDEKQYDAEIIAEYQRCIRSPIPPLGQLCDYWQGAASATGGLVCHLRQPFS